MVTDSSASVGNFAMRPAYSSPHVWSSTPTTPSVPAACTAAPARRRGSLSEHAALQVRVAGLGTEPDREQCPGEVVAGHRPTGRAVHRDLETGTGSPGERHRVA